MGLQLVIMLREVMAQFISRLMLQLITEYLYKRLTLLSVRFLIVLNRNSAKKMIIMMKKTNRMVWMMSNHPKLEDQYQVLQS